MRVRWSLIQVIVLLMGLSLLTACGGSSDDGAVPRSVVDEQLKNNPAKQPVLKLPEVPDQPELPRFHRNITLELQEENLSFEEPVTVTMKQYGTWVSPYLYSFTKSYVGKEDNSVFMFWGHEDDIKWITPWKIISVNLNNFRVFGGSETGEGVPIGYVQWNGVDQKNFKLIMQTEFSVDVNHREIIVKPPINVATMVNCPTPVHAVGLCEIYIGLYNALYSIDFAAFGAVGPDIAADVISFNAIFKLAKGFFTFEPDVEQIRKYYLVPLLKAIGNLKTLKDVDQSDEGYYLQRTRETYSTLIITSVDSVIKTQKMMPEAIEDLGAVGFGVLLAYIGMNDAADKKIGKNQPAWFTEIVSPIIREFGVLSIDLLLNGSNSSLEDRINRFVAMEDQVRTAVIKLCKASPSADNECAAALNQ